MSALRFVGNAIVCLFLANLAYKLLFPTPPPVPAPRSLATHEALIGLTGQTAKEASSPLPAEELRPAAGSEPAPSASGRGREAPIQIEEDVAPLHYSAPAASRDTVCGTKFYCNEMRTCAEAKYFMDECGLDRLDADNDGIPCETVCGKTKRTMAARLRARPFTPPAGEGTAFGLADVDASEPTFTCAGKRTCRQMDSCEEATFYLKKCGVRSLDGNRDGIACNGLCR